MRTAPTKKTAPTLPVPKTRSSPAGTGGASCVAGGATGTTTAATVQMKKTVRVWFVRRSSSSAVAANASLVDSVATVVAIAETGRTKVLKPARPGYAVTMSLRVGFQLTVVYPGSLDVTVTKTALMGRTKRGAKAWTVSGMTFPATTASASGLGHAATVREVRETWSSTCKLDRSCPFWKLLRSTRLRL